MTKPKRKVVRKKVLHLIGGLLIASAAVRMVPVGQAVAEGAQKPPQTNDAMMTEADTSTETVDAEGLLAALQAREEALAAREQAFEDRLLAMEIAEGELQEQLTALQAAEASLRETIALAESAAANDLERLTRVYENMKPKDAAALFEEMSPEFAAGFLGMMDPVAAAGIMTLLNPDTAYSVSAVLAGRNANVPTQ